MIVTFTTVQVLKLFANGEEWYAKQIVDATNLSPGTIHPMLERLIRAGLLISRWETDGGIAGRRVGERLGTRRRYYRLTEQGRIDVQQILAEAKKLVELRNRL